MEQSQVKALAALQPFIIEATTTKNPSPRYLSDLITRATSAPGTFIFTELLQTSAIQSLKAPDVLDTGKAHLRHLELFSWGTYEEYQNTPHLPPLTETQSLKLRQLSLLTLASPFAPAPFQTTDLAQTNNLTYDALLRSLSLPSRSDLETLITQSIYSGLLTARLSPTSSPPTVHVTSVAPLRDLRPASLPALMSILETWSGRCDVVISSLQSKISTVRNNAERRSRETARKQKIVDKAVLSPASELGSGPNLGPLAGRVRKRQGNKRDIGQTEEMDDFGADDVSSDEAAGRMELDEGFEVAGGASTGTAGAGSGGGATGGARGAKRNRGRG